MGNEYILLSIFISAVCTLGLRAIPFLLAGKRKEKSDKLEFLGRILPPAIMAVLIVYCLRDVPSDIHFIGLPKIVGVVITGITYVWKQNTFVSIILGTITYMILIKVI